MSNFMLIMMERTDWALKIRGIDLDDIANLKMNAKILSQEIEKIQIGDGGFIVDSGSAVHGLWGDKHFVERL